MSKLPSIKEIETILKEIEDPKDDRLQKYGKDSRIGVQRLIKRWMKQKREEEMQSLEFQQLCIFEKELRDEGYQYITGIDEVGRGPIAGPVVAAAVILPSTFFLPGINDSKKLSEKKRELCAKYITKHAISVGIGIVSSNEIDQINIYQATKKAMISAIHQLNVKPEYLLIDAMQLEVPYPQKSIIKGDSKSVSIAAASIMAKVTRDRMMKEYAEEYKDYGFEKNMGYGTREHLNGLKLYGATPIHRKSFAPVKDLSRMKELSDS
ncbi:ribonuclease HII [Bacillus pakistanensis]|uniref:Ribonuclease HII n=1 Tax=Rossellomorea pakistanensis TaxID=992288 RepID=A0ABS2NG50_9BACI|nr:ribonuclease HII [Bacillus pakistanensis]MBM7586814.1 ribonuclease HII [Bacillus pakistanensis]